MTNATILAAIFTIIYITVITVAGELNTPLKTMLAKTFSHHWIGKGITAIIVFVFFNSIFLILKPKIKTSFLINLLTAASILAALAISAFFTWETLR